MRPCLKLQADFPQASSIWARVWKKQAEQTNACEKTWLLVFFSYEILYSFFTIGYLMYTHNRGKVTLVFFESLWVQSPQPWSGRAQTKGKECVVGFSRYSWGRNTLRDEPKKYLCRRLLWIEEFEALNSLFSFQLPTFHSVYPPPLLKLRLHKLLLWDALGRSAYSQENRNLSRTRQIQVLLKSSSWSVPF